MTSGLQEALRGYIGESKFAPAAWERRGLNPSGAQMCRRMEEVMNKIATALLHTSTTDASPGTLRQSLESSLRSVNSIEFDTEEREFICDEVNRLGHMAGVNVGSALNRWLYGPFLGTLVNLTRGSPKS